MSSQAQHPLERRATMLAARLTQRVQVIKDSLQMAQGRLPFHTMLPRNEALDWWTQHRYDQYGQQALANMDPMAVAHLDQALSQYQTAQANKNNPQLGAPAPDPYSPPSPQDASASPSPYPQDAQDAVNSVLPPSLGGTNG